MFVQQYTSTKHEILIKPNGSREANGIIICNIIMINCNTYNKYSDKRYWDM